MKPKLKPYRTGVHISIRTDFKEFHIALKTVSAKLGMKMGDYIYHAIMKDERFLKELKDLK